MPTLPRLTQRRLLLAGVLLAAVLVAMLLLTAPGPLDAARAKYDRIEVGMSEGEVKEILIDYWPTPAVGNVRFWSMGWYDQRSEATIIVDFDVDGRVTDKVFDEGDQSFGARVERFKDRLADRLHPRR